MKKIFLLFLVTILSENLSAQGKAKLFGKVTDFNSNPIDSVSVILKNDKFENVYETMTDKDGNFSMSITKEKYFCLYAIKSADYGKTKLEYWAWNVPVYNNIEINPQYDKMEMYGLNAWEPKLSPYETYMIYFRPMSLTKSLKFTNEQNKTEFEKNAESHHDTIDIAPQNIF